MSFKNIKKWIGGILTVFLIFLLFFTPTKLAAQTVLLNENFSGGSLPSGWSNVNNGGTSGQIWQFNDPGGRNITAGNFSGNYAILDSDNYGNGNNQNARLITPTFSTGIYETITLEFDYQYRDYNGGESCVVEVYNGTTWTEVFRKEEGEDNYNGANLETINITTQAGGASNAQVRFTYIGAWDWWWAIDNVKITATSPSTTNTYLGPGGVGNTNGSSNLVLWLNPDKGANSNSTWTDQSGNGYNFSGGTGATLNTTDINGYNSYSFNGSTNYFEKSYEATLNPTEFSVFTANNVSSNTNYKAVVSNRDDPSGTPTRGFILYAVPTSNNWSFWTGRDASVWETTGTTTSTAASWASQNLLYRNVTNGKKLYINNSLNATNSHSITVNNSRPFRVGAGRNETTPDYYFSGKMGEIIMFDKSVNNAQRIIINNYLSAKYGFTLSSEDYYNQDNGGSGNFDHNVAGIGRASDGSIHLDSQGTGIIRINNPSDLNNDEFLFWGEDVKSANYDFSSSAVTNYIERLDTKWRVSKRNNLGTVSVSVKASDLTLNSPDGCNDLKLIVSSSSTFASKTTYNFVLSGGVYTATGVTLNNNNYFTIEYIDLIVVDGTQFYNGSGTGYVPNTTNGCYKLLVKNTANGSLTLTENANVREVEVESSGKLVVNTATRLQVTNGINNNGDIRLLGTSQLLQTHTGVSQVTGSGFLYKDQEGILTNVYQSGYWTSPVTTNGSTFTIKGVLKDGTTPTSASSNPPDIYFTDIHTLDGAKTFPITISGRWLAKLINADDWTRQISPTSVTFNPGEGWNMKSTGGGKQNYTFKGIINDGEYSSSISQDKLSLIGNPYPSAIDADKFILDNSTAISGALYFYESGNEVSHYRGTYTGGYASRVIGLGTPYGAGITPGQYIPVGQAFFVGRNAVGSANITFNNAQRVFQTRGASSQFFSKNSGNGNNNQSVINKDFPVLRLGFEFNVDESEIFHRQVAIGFRGLTSALREGYDAEMLDRKPSDISLKVDDVDVPFVIIGIEDFNYDMQIPLHVYLDINRMVTFNIDSLENLDTPIYLTDKFTKQQYQLTKEGITLDLTAGEYKDRFTLEFKKNIALSLTDDILKNNITTYIDYTTKALIIKNPKNIMLKAVELHSILGQKVFSSNIMNNTSENKFPLSSHIKSGIYFIKIHSEKGGFVRKVFIGN